MSRPSLIPGITLKAFWPKSKAQAQAVSASYQKAIKAYRDGPKAAPCTFCGLVSRTNELVDDDARLDRDAGQRWHVVCSGCHAYLRVGQEPVKGLLAFEHGFYAKQTRLMHVDPVDGPDAPTLNALMRSIGMAMAHDDSKAEAHRVYEAIADAESVKQTEQVYGTNLSTEMGQALAELAKEPERYNDREEALVGMRLLFHPAVLRGWGARLLQERGGKANPASWPHDFEEKLAAIENKLNGADRIEGFSVVPQSISELDPDEDDRL